MKKLIFTLLALFMSLSSWAQTTTFYYSSTGDISDRFVQSKFTGATDNATVTSLGDGNYQAVFLGTVTSIGEEAFSGCSSLTSIIIPEGVAGIGKKAFYVCTKLTSVSIPSSMVDMGDQVFKSCTSLVTLICPATTPPLLGSNAFSGCNALKIYVPAGSVSDYTTAWSGKYGTATITAIPGGTCGTDVTYVFNPGTGVLTISGTGAMEDYASADEQPWYSYASNITSVVIENGVTRIGGGVFDQCKSLTSVSIPNSVTSIGNYAFWNCTSLTSVSIPNSVTRIDYGAFEGCTSLASVTIPASVTSIGNNAFNGCTSLTSVTLKSFPTFGGQAFYNVKAGCTFTLALNDAEHPYIATVTTNAPSFTTKTYTRTVAEAGKYQALYVPFALSVTTNLADFDVYSLGTITSTSVELTPLTEGSTTANTPYIIKAKAENAKIEKTGFDIGTPAENTASGTPFDVVGTYHTVKYANVTGDWYALKDGKFMKAGTGAYLNPMRFYLEATSSAKDCLEFVFSEETTSIENLDAVRSLELGVRSYYNLAGQKVGNDYKGVVIINGKKVLK